MERACELLRNRLDDLEEIQTAKKSQQGNELNSLVLRLKRQERLRVLKENEIMDALFSFKTAGRAERIAFESSSCELMKRIAPNFEFESKSSGLYKDIAQLYSSFYKHINNPLKVEEIRVINQNTTYHNFPFLCMLLKGIVQYAKGLFLQALQINSQLSQLPQSSTASASTSNSNNNNNNNHQHKYYRSLTPPLPSSTNKQTFPQQQNHLPASPQYKQVQPPQSSKFKQISQGTSTTPQHYSINTQNSQVRDISQQFPPQFLYTKQQQHSDERSALSTSNPIKRNQSYIRFNGQESSQPSSSAITPSLTFLGFPRSYPISSKQKFLAYQQNVLSQQPGQSFNAYNFTQNNNVKYINLDILITQGHINVLGSVQFSKRGYYRPIREAMEDIDCLQFKRNELLANFYYKTMLNRNQGIARTIDYHRQFNSKNIHKSQENQLQGQPQINEKPQVSLADPVKIIEMQTQNVSPTKNLLIKSNSQSQLCQSATPTGQDKRQHNFPAMQAHSNNKCTPRNNEFNFILQRESQAIQEQQESNPCRQSRTDEIHQIKEGEDRGRFSCSNSERNIQNHQKTLSLMQRTVQIQKEAIFLESFNTESLICIKGQQNLTSNSEMNAEDNTTFTIQDQTEKDNFTRVTVQNSLLSIIQSNSNKAMQDYNLKQINKLSDSNNNDKIKSLEQYQQTKSKRTLSQSCPEKDQAETKAQQSLTSKSKQKPTLLANIVDECQTKEQQYSQSKVTSNGQALWRRSILTKNKPSQPSVPTNIFAGVQDTTHPRSGSQHAMDAVKQRSRAISNGTSISQNKKQQSGYYFRGNFSRNNNPYHLHKQHQQYPISFDMLKEFEEEEAQKLNQMSTQEQEYDDNKLQYPVDYQINNHKTLPLYNITENTLSSDINGVQGQQNLFPVIPQSNIAQKKEQKQLQQISLSSQQQQFLQSYRPSHSLENQSESTGVAVGGVQNKNKRAISYSSQLEAFNNQLLQRKDRLNGIILSQNVVNDINNNRAGSSLRIENTLESYQNSKTTTPMPGSARKRQLVEDVILPCIA